MADLGFQIESYALKELTIPGSHDSGTYGMVDAAAAQGVNVYEQLRAGARYLDLRVEWNKNAKQRQLPIRDPDYYMYHGDYVSDNKWSSVLDQIERFLRENQREILILYVRLYPREGQDEKTERLKVWDPLLKRFPNQLADQDPASVKLKDLWNSGRRIVIFAEFSKDVELYPKSIWPADKMRSYYANTSDTNTLLQRLDENVRQPRGEDIWQLGTQLTPSEAEVISSAGGTLPWGSLHELAKKSTPLILKRLQNEWLNLPLNIVTGDYVHEFGFCEAVIKYNQAAQD